LGICCHFCRSILYFSYPLTSLFKIWDLFNNPVSFAHKMFN
jgi:hypothetical protein